HRGRTQPQPHHAGRDNAGQGRPSPIRRIPTRSPVSGSSTHSGPAGGDCTRDGRPAPGSHGSHAAHYSFDCRARAHHHPGDRAPTDYENRSEPPVTSSVSADSCQEARFRAMGCGVHVVAVGGPCGLAAQAQRQIGYLESIWSRFRPGSDIARANSAAGQAIVVSPLTLTLVTRAVEGWRRTAGRFDPTVLTALEAMGYDRSFERVASSVHPPRATGPSPGCEGIIVDRVASTLTIPLGVRFDAGGIGKGLAADLVTRALVKTGASGACVNLGGDMRVIGHAPTSDGWTIGLEDPYDQEQELARAVITDAGVATSSRTYRTWERAGAQVHHLIDPATGASAWTDLASVTVVAATAWWAEVLAKVAFLAGPVEGADLITGSGASGVLVDDGGFAHPIGGGTWEMAPCWR
ncbi:MAG: FAD:protein FMN transferase, partial [Actinomycetota bacterium]|nr:FAD:protein FMN transferase [Actinomycetota bacterium]